MLEVPNFIEIYPNCIPDEMCNQILHIYESAQEKGFTLGRAEHSENPDSLYFKDTCLFGLDYGSGEVYREFNGILWGKGFLKYREKYGMLDNVGTLYSFESKIQKTEPSEGFHAWHCEAMSRHDSNRILTWTVYLNDDFEAGETEFLYQQYRYKPKKGDLVIFPAAFTHTHRGNPPIGGVKYIMTGWITF